MKVLTGVHQPDEGEIIFDGEPMTFATPASSRSRGIEMIYQDFALADNLDVRSNIFLGREPRKNLLGPLLRIVDRKFMESETKRVLDSLDIAINPKLKVRRLSGGQRQAVAIGRALAFDARLIIMDEPTANLSVAKVDKLIEVTQRLRISVSRSSSSPTVSTRHSPSQIDSQSCGTGKWSVASGWARSPRLTSRT